VHDATQGTEYIDIARASVDIIRRGLTFRDVTATTDNAEVNDNVILADATSNNITITLPPVAEAEGMLLRVKKIDSSVNTVTVDGDGTETIDGATTNVLSAQYDQVTIYCDGVEWWIF
jgi:hypothetical protein